MFSGDCVRKLNNNSFCELPVLGHMHGLVTGGHGPLCLESVTAVVRESWLLSVAYWLRIGCVLAADCWLLTADYRCHDAQDDAVSEPDLREMGPPAAD